MTHRLTFNEMWEACQAHRDGNALILRDGLALVVSNGSRWGGRSPGGLLPLFRALKKETLTEWAGVELRPEWDGNEQPPQGYWHAGGNFKNLSHVFSIYSNSPRLLAALSKHFGN